jgi:branched-chain amino acid transport system substrate-binding protein
MIHLKMSRKSAALCLAAALALVILAVLAVGCGGSTTTTSAAAPASSETTAPASTETTAAPTETTAASTETTVASTDTTTAASTLPADAPQLVIGDDASLSSFLAPFGAYQTWAHQAAVDAVNAKGGITIDGKAYKVVLKIYDDKSDGNVASSNVDTLITKDKVVAVLGPIVPTVGNPAALAAERKKVPYVETGNPLEVFRQVTKWQYAFDFFVQLSDGAETTFAAVDSVKAQTNGKVALCVDNSPDGPGQLAGWKASAATHGWTVTEMPAFPEGTTDFTSLVSKLKSANCDFVCVMGDTPDLIALRKQMDAAGYKPKLLQFSRGAQVQQFADGLGKLADGIMHFSYWSPDLPYPGAADLGKLYAASAKQSIGQIVGPEYAAAQILLDAIAKAGSTDATYVCGPVKFAADHTSVEPSLQFQWSGGVPKIIWTADVANAKLIFPLP